MKSNERKIRISIIPKEIFLLMVATIWLIPVYSAIEYSLRNGFSDYLTVLNAHIGDMLIFPRMALNSLAVTGITMLLIGITGTLAAYAFAKFDFRGKQLIYVLIVSCYAIPIVSALIPNSLTIKVLNLRGTYTSMILLLAAANLPMALMILRGNIASIPDALLEAAAIDGSSPLHTLTTVVVPVVRAGIVNMLVVMFIQVWNDFQIPLIFATTTEMYTLTLAPSFYSQADGRLNLSTLYASIVIIGIPVVIFYFFMQDKIMEGMTMGSVKG